MAFDESKTADLSRDSFENSPNLINSKEEIKHERHHRKHQLSVSSDDLVEIEKYYRQM